MQYSFSLNEKVALVTGATGYLGREMCIGLGEAGANILVNSRSEENAQALVSELKSKGLKAEKAVFDVSVEQEVEQFFLHYSGDINIIVNNAYAGSAGTIESSNGQFYLDAFDISVVSAHNILQKALPKLRDSVRRVGDASVINIASMYGVVSPDLRIYSSPSGSNPPFYGAAKAALIQWTKYGACEFGKEGIRFNSISPGPFPNPETNNVDFRKVLENRVPLGRVGHSEEVKGPVVFLASSASSFVNGSNLKVDGGWTAW
ncbi:SDR family oxidoreductase [Vibrio sp. ZSDE26]|uniref:SDR family oxidoreductase n=1 Tax=Vibrio amylolyticus TaxID=2847292 RepID=A0A9X2BJA2_9VIBR|nr:SDR family oxidoreductase [Vibrio amylolyticus]MCK6263257.1 SDR family oxidoreductase [Vibrio amylolyticus]